jgi:hypothetical protein
MAIADMYLQFPGGGNNRLNEPNRARRNNNRLFDSQNNNRFGYNQAGYYFLTESIIDMQWTVQHSCGPDSNVHCDVILQYGCDEQLRDGQLTNTIPIRASDCVGNDCNSDFRYGMHENYQYYQHCSLRERNKGLFPADRNIRGNNARYTRQEERGTRYGYECNEERDYYPYWHPTIWRDIAIFTDDTTRCPYYQQESENVKGRWYCHVDDNFLNTNYNPGSGASVIPINEADCNALEGGTWMQSNPHKYPNGDALEPPVCVEAPFQRDNHHGNGDGRYMVGHKWKVPENLVHASCAVRIRYNMTNADFDGWNTTKESRDINNRLDDYPSTYNGQCFGLGEGPNKFGIVSGVRFDDLNNFDIETATEIIPRSDERITLTRESASSDIWTVKTKTRGGFQSVGWISDDLGSKTVKLSFEIKFAIKPTGNNYGALFFNQWERDWVNDAEIGQWHTVEIEKLLPRNGNSETVQLVFDRTSVEFDLRNFQLCVIDELADGNPFFEIQDAFDWGPYEARQRGYEHKNDANVQIFDRIPMRLQNPYNTDQLGRVFEDRSHKLKFVRLPAEIKADIDANNFTVWNLNARGKIGNNVEVYPAFEYAFTPSRIVAKEGDYLHIQFSGSNTNDWWNDHSHTEPNGDPVHVIRGKDRYNMVSIDSMDSLRPSTDISKLSRLLGFDEITSMCMQFGGVHGGDNEYLQTAGAYFDNEIRKLTVPGKHMFYSSINTKHGVRSHKGKIIVQDAE